MPGPFQINAVDEQFAVSTGSNVRAGDGTSIFDYPPNTTKNLLIETHEGDSDWRLFEIGDSYTVSWGGSGGESIENAVVVRSDTAGGDTGIIVFEGTDSAGQLAQVIWTPNFDLENWYWTNYNPSAEPQFYWSDQNASYTHEYICFDKSTMIHTPRGLVRAGKLQQGETVCTWGGTARRILWTGRRTVDARDRAAPVRFAKGSIGNFAPFKLSPQHRVLVTAPQARALYGNAEVLVPAVALVNDDTIRRAPRDSVTYVHILLEQHDILLACGAPCESLLPTTRTRDLLSIADRTRIHALVGDNMAPCRPVLSCQQTLDLAWTWKIPERAPAFF